MWLHTLGTRLIKTLIKLGSTADLLLTPGHPHVGSHFETWVNVDDCAPHHITGKMSRDELHGGCQVVSGLVALLCVVVCVVREIKNM